MPDLFDVLFPPDPETDHPAIHEIRAALVDYASGVGITTNQFKSYLINNFGLDVQGENQADQIFALIDAETEYEQKIAKATEIGMVCYLRAHNLLYENNAEVKTRLGF